MSYWKLLSLPVIALIIILVGYFLWRVSVSPVNSHDIKPHSFLVTKGQNVGQIGTNLEKEGIIRNSLIFRVYVKLTGRDKSIQSGQYKLALNLSLEQIIMTLAKGPQALWVTYPEGVRREEIAIRTIKGLELTESEGKVFWSEFLTASRDSEGYLFPDTYLFPREASASAVVRKMTQTFDSKFTPDMEKSAKDEGLTRDKAVILASIIERETLTDEERPIVAGILLKRIEAGWPLQTDATLQYLVTTKKCPPNAVRTFDTCANSDFNWWQVPTVEDKKIESPYNTYLNHGLPPGPISNPGLVSLKAAVNPKSSDYWFYLHGSDGKIHYAKTESEHEQNIQKYL